MQRLRIPTLTVVVFFLIIGNPTAADRVIPRGAKLYITKMPEDLDLYLKAEIVKKKVSVELVNSQDDAEYILKGTAEGDEDRKWHEGWLTAEKDHVTAAIEVVDQEGNFVWASEAGDRSWFWGALKRGGPRKVAERLANNLKDVVKKE